MAGTSLTSGFDVVVQINARNFELLIRQRIGPLLSLSRSLGLEDPATGAPLGTLTFAGAPDVRFFLGAGPGMQFDLELVLENAAYALTGRPPVSMGPGRSTFALSTTLLSAPLSPTDPTAPPLPPGQVSHQLSVMFDWASASFVPFDGGGLASAGVSTRAVAAQIAAAVRRLLGGSSTIALAQFPLVVDGRPDPPGAPPMRAFQAAIIRTPLTTTSPNVDVFAFGLSLLLGTTGNISTVRSGVGPLDEGTIAINNAFLFNRIVTALGQSPPTGLGIPASAFSSTPAGAPNTLAINPGTRITVNGQGLKITNFTLVATASTLTLTSHYQFSVPPGVDFDVDVNGPITFALVGGNLVAGAALTNSVSYRISVVGGVVIALAAAVGLILSAVSFGTAAAPVAVIGTATVTAAIIVTLAFVDTLVGQIGSLLGPTFQTSIEAAFSGAGGGGIIPPGLLSLLGGTISFTPPLIFDDFTVGASFPGMSLVSELRRVEAVSVLPGTGLDLDNNTTIPATASGPMPGIDLLWAAEGYPVLRAQGGAKLNRLTQNFDDLTGSQLDRLVVGTSQSIAGSAIPVVPAEGAIPDPVVLGVLTDERRHAKVAVWQDRYGRLIIRYVIYDTLAPAMRIQRARPVWQVISSVRTEDTPATWLTSPKRNYRVANQGGFRAVCHRAVAPVNYFWSLGGSVIDGSGAVTVSGSPVSFVVGGDSCVLTTEIGAELDAELVCIARDAAGSELNDRIRLVAYGTQSVPYGRAGLLARLDSLDQLVVTRIEDIRPDPPPDHLIRVERDRLVDVSSGAATTRPASHSASLAEVEISILRAIREAGGPQLPNLRLR